MSSSIFAVHREAKLDEIKQEVEGLQQEIQNLLLQCSCADQGAPSSSNSNIKIFTETEVEALSEPYILPAGMDLYITAEDGTTLVWYRDNSNFSLVSQNELTTEAGTARLLWAQSGNHFKRVLTHAKMVCWGARVPMGSRGANATLGP